MGDRAEKCETCGIPLTEENCRYIHDSCDACLTIRCDLFLSNQTTILTHSIPDWADSNFTLYNE